MFAKYMESHSIFFPPPDYLPHLCLTQEVSRG